MLLFFISNRTLSFFMLFFDLFFLIFENCQKKGENSIAIRWWLFRSNSSVVVVVVVVVRVSSSPLFFLFQFFHLLSNPRVPPSSFRCFVDFRHSDSIYNLHIHIHTHIKEDIESKALSLLQKILSWVIFHFRCGVVERRHRGVSARVLAPQNQIQHKRNVIFVIYLLKKRILNFTWFYLVPNSI